MNKYDTSLLLLKVVMAYLIILFVLLLIGSATEVVGEIPCVDGKNRINLEGIMCEETKFTYFGVEEKYIYLLFITPIVLVILSFWVTYKEEI
jgi:hypothetical protein